MKHSASKIQNDLRASALWKDLVNLTVKANPFFRSYPCFRHGYELAALVCEALRLQPAKMRAAPMRGAFDVMLGDSQSNDFLDFVDQGEVALVDFGVERGHVRHVRDREVFDQLLQGEINLHFAVLVIPEAYIEAASVNSLGKPQSLGQSVRCHSIRARHRIPRS